MDLAFNHLKWLIYHKSKPNENSAPGNYGIVPNNIKFARYPLFVHLILQ